MNKIKSENGFWTIFIVFTLVSATVLGLGALVLNRTGGADVGNTLHAIQIKCAAEGAILNTIEMFKLGTFNENTVYTVGAVTVTMDTTYIGGNESLLTVNASVGDFTQTTTLNITSGTNCWLEDYVIFTRWKAEDNLIPVDEDGIIDYSKKSIMNDSIPAVNIDLLKSMAIDQGHYFKVVGGAFGGTISFPAGYPNDNFYYAPNVPNVTFIESENDTDAATFVRYGTTYGIMVVVAAAVYTKAAGALEGVLFLPGHYDEDWNLDPLHTMEMYGEGDYLIVGGAIANGNLEGIGVCKHNPEYMREFCDFLTYNSGNGEVTVTW
ncbi:hypothetical protein BVY01_03045 [bacterium I07]|nr:hypothetical protein BVY01_03045 [bacterium I07]